VTLRPATEKDFDEILRLNAESVHFLSPLGPESLASLHQEAAYHRVLEDGRELVAFLLAFREGARYESPNYQWFSSRYAEFLYIDRVAVCRACQGQRLGRLLYQDLFSYARRSGVPRITCEFDIDPPNEASRRFHQRYGFKEVGTQTVAGGTKLVSLQIASLSS
jgi:predicted GNAT superfamily acetyltransferase